MELKPSMKLLQITAPGHYEIVESAVPDIGEHQLLMEIEAVTTCPRWDLCMFSGRDVLDVERTPSYPLLAGWPGHETAGTVVRVGSRVKRFKVGDRIMAHAAKMYVPGETGYAEYMRFTEQEVEPIPSGMSFTEAAPFELLKCVIKGLRQFPAFYEKTVAVTGLGPAGLLAVQAAAILGAKRVIGIDSDERRRAWARQYTSAEIIAPEALKDYTFDYGFDCVGYAAAVQSLVDHARSKVVVFGVLHGQVVLDDEHWKRSFRFECFDMSPITRDDLDMALYVLAHPQMNMASIVTHEGRLSAYGDAVKLLEAKEAVKVCFYPRREFSQVTIQ